MTATRGGIALIAAAIAAAALNGSVFPHGSGWVVGLVLLSFGVTLVSRGRGWNQKRRRPGIDEREKPRVRPLKPGEAYDNAVRLAVVPNIPLAEMWCQRLRKNGIEAFYKGVSQFGAFEIALSPANPQVDLFVGEHDLDRARALFPELR